MPPNRGFDYHHLVGFSPNPFEFDSIIYLYGQSIEKRFLESFLLAMLANIDLINECVAFVTNFS
jgi:hypothetical protein